VGTALKSLIYTTVAVSCGTAMTRPARFWAQAEDRVLQQRTTLRDEEADNLTSAVTEASSDHHLIWQWKSRSLWSGRSGSPLRAVHACAPLCASTRDGSDAYNPSLPLIRASVDGSDLQKSITVFGSAP
jgi:hypothetical protein